MKIIVDALPTDPKECLFSKWNCEFGYVCKFCNALCNISLCKFLSCDSKETSGSDYTNKTGNWIPEDSRVGVLHRCSNCQNSFHFSFSMQTGNYYPDKYCRVCGSRNTPSSDYSYLYEVEDNET